MTIGTVARQHTHEIGVAVIDDVKDVEFLAPRLEPARIVPHPVGDAIGPFGQARRPDERQPGEPAGHGGPKLGRLDAAQVRSPEIEEQHLRHEVHAVPSLLAQVGDDGDARQLHATAPDWNHEVVERTLQRPRRLKPPLHVIQGRGARLRAISQRCVPS